jgi:hypothetical protein
MGLWIKFLSACFYIVLTSQQWQGSGFCGLEVLVKYSKNFGQHWGLKQASTRSRIFQTGFDFPKRKTRTDLRFAFFETGFWP